MATIAKWIVINNQIGMAQYLLENPMISNVVANMDMYGFLLILPAV
jgi:hypothetical protein